MRIYELLDKYGIYGKPSSKRTNTDGSNSPLTSADDASWRKDKNNIMNWFKRPFLTNGRKGK